MIAFVSDIFLISSWVKFLCLGSAKALVSRNNAKTGIHVTRMNRILTSGDVFTASGILEI
jgi:hypothetical protein